MLSAIHQPKISPLTLSGAGGTGGLHPTTAGIIAALVSAGASPTKAQQKAMDVFIRAEISAGRWGSVLAYLMVPAWGAAGPNALDWVSLTSGSFLGAGHSHTGGVWKPNGSTAYYNTNRTPAQLGQTTASGMIGALLTAAGSNAAATQVIFHSYNGTTQISEMQHSSLPSTFIADYNSSSAPGRTLISIARASQRGILMLSRHGGSRAVYRRHSGGITTLASTVGADAGSIPAVQYKLARSDFGGGVAYNDAPYGLAFAGAGVDATGAEAMTANLATLYTALTGNALPA
jgi:hypothetical protein